MNLFQISPVNQTPLAWRGRLRALAFLTLLTVAAVPLHAQVEDAPVGVAVKIYAQGQGSGAYVSLYGTFLASSPTAGDAYASATAYASSPTYKATPVLGTQGYVRVEPGKSYTLSVSSSNASGLEANVVAPPGYRVVMDQMIRSRETFSGSATIVFQVQSLGASHPGLAGMASSVSSTEVEWRVSLGSLRNGGSAGDLALIDTGTRTDWAPLFTPGSLYYEPTSDEISLYRPGNILRQILANQVAVDIVTLTSTSYEIRCYHPTQVVGTSFPRTFTGQPYITYRVEQGSTATALKFTKEVRNVNDATATSFPVARREFMTLARTGGTWPAATWTRRDWTLEGATALAETYVVSGGTTAARTETIAVRPPGSGAAVLKVTRNYTVPTTNNVSVIGEVLSSETVGTATGLSASFNYYTDPLQFGSLGYLKSATLPGGNWVAYDYYDADLTVGYRGGRVKYAYKPYLNAPATITQSASTGEVTYYEYVNDLFGTPTRPSLVQTTVNGTVAGKTTTVYNDSYGTANGFGLVQTTQTGYANATQSLVSLVRYYRDDAADAFIRGQTYSVTGPDGVKQAFGYQRGTWDGTTFAPGGGAIGTGTASRIMVVNGSSNAAAGTACPAQDGYQFDAVYLVDGKSTKEVTIRNSRALVARTESHVWKNGAWQRVNFTDYTYDFAGRLTSRIASNGATYRAYYDADLKATETDEAGVMTNYTYDVADRVATATRTGSGPIAAVATQYGYDAAGRVLQQTVGTGAEQLVTTHQYDDAGRLTAETPPGLGATTHSYDPANRTHTVTQPAGGATTVETAYLDGKPFTATGTAVVPTYRTYGVESDGRRWQQTNTGSAASPRWTKSWTDWLGRGLRGEAPGFGGQANLVTESFYQTGAGLSSTGHLLKTTKSGYAPTLYEYNVLGQVSRSGLDANNDGLLILASADRIGETDTTLEAYNGGWWSRTDNKTYPKIGLTTLVISTSRTRLTGHPANRLSETQSVDAEGNVTTQFVDVDRAARTSTATTTRSGFPTAQVETTRNGYPTGVTGFDGLTTTTAYDALLRRSSVTDSRNNQTTTAYYAGTSLPSTLTDAAGDVATTYYDTLGRVSAQRDPRSHYTRYEYNLRGQVLRQWGDGTFPVSYGYDNTYGERTTMSTYRGGTGFDGATWPGSPGAADTTTWTFDPGTGLLSAKTDAPTTAHPSGKTAIQTYNLRGQTATRTLARGVTTTYGYDSATGELLSQTYSDSTPAVTFTYGRTGQVESVSDFTGIRDLIYDPTKPWRLTAEAESPFYGNRVMTRLYDESGVIGRVRGFQVGPTAGSSAELEQTFGFTTVGRFETLSSKRNANDAASARTFRYTYRSDAALIQSLSIDGGSAFSVTRAYEDHRDLVTTLDTQWSTVSQARYAYVYNELGQRTSTVQSGSVFGDYGDATLRLYTYDGRGEVTADAGYLGSNAADQSKPLPGRFHEFSYDNIGNRQSSNRTGVTALADTYTTNALNQYTQRSNNTVPVSGTAAADTAPAGNAGGTAVIVQGRTVAAGRQGNYWNDEITVPNVLHPWRGPVTIFTAKRGTGGSADLYRVDSRMTEVAAVLQDMVYDDDGNLTSDGLVDYQWDAENRLIRMETTTAAQAAGFPHKLLEFRYDYLGRRVQKRVVDLDQNQEIYCRRFLYDGWNLLGEYAAPGGTTIGTLLRSYTWGLDIALSQTNAGGVGALLQIADHPSGKSYLPAYDGNGNIVSLLNAATGATAAIYEYGPFGESLRAQSLDPTIADNPWRFSTKFADSETGLVYYGKRFYDPRNGRFLGRDPIEESGGINLYGFCANNAVNKWDLLGMDGEDDVPFPWQFVPSRFRPTFGPSIRDKSLDPYTPAGFVETAAADLVTNGPARFDEFRNRPDVRFVTVGVVAVSAAAGGWMAFGGLAVVEAGTTISLAGSTIEIGETAGALLHASGLTVYALTGITNSTAFVANFFDTDAAVSIAAAPVSLSSIAATAAGSLPGGKIFGDSIDFASSVLDLFRSESAKDVIKTIPDLYKSEDKLLNGGADSDPIVSDEVVVTVNPLPKSVSIPRPYQSQQTLWDNSFPGASAGSAKDAMNKAMDTSDHSMEITAQWLKHGQRK